MNRAAIAPSGPNMISLTTKSFLGRGKMKHVGFAEAPMGTWKV